MLFTGCQYCISWWSLIVTEQFTSILQNVTCLKFYSLVILMQHINYKCGKGHLIVKILVNGKGLTNPVHLKFNYLHFIIYPPVKSPWFNRYGKSSEKEKALWAIKIRKGKSADGRMKGRKNWLRTDWADCMQFLSELWMNCLSVALL